MGNCVSSEVVPFKATVWWGDISRGSPYNTGVPMLEEFLEALYGEESEGDLVPGQSYGSWVVPDPSWDRYGEISASVLEKDGKRVYALNEDKYSGVGGVTLTFFADDESVLQQFIEDCGLGGRDHFSKIEKNRPVLYFY